MPDIKDEKESRLVDIILDNLTPESAQRLLKAYNAEEAFNALGHDPYRTNLRAQVERALQGEKTRTGLEGTIQTTPTEITTFDETKIYLSVYTKAITETTKSIAKRLYTGIKETFKAILYPLLPGKWQEKLDENAARSGPRRAAYNTIALIYDAAMAETAWLFFVPIFAEPFI